MNTLLIFARLESGPIITVSENNIKVARFKVIEGKNVFDSVAFDDVAEKCISFVSDDEVYIEGSIRINEWRDEETNTINSAQIVVNKIFACKVLEENTENT